jgi:hypothetical protein
MPETMDAGDFNDTVVTLRIKVAQFLMYLGQAQALYVLLGGDTESFHKTFFQGALTTPGILAEIHCGKIFELTAMNKFQ